MTETMIDRVAEVLDEWVYSSGYVSSEHKKLVARAIIEVMREPTAAMLDNGCADFPNAATPYRSDEYLPAAKQIYEAMIDAALEKVPA